MKKCKTCPNAVHAADLKRCQSKRCHPKGNIYCPSCISQQEGDFMSPFFCKKCNREKLRKSRPKPVAAPVRAERKPVDKTGWCMRLVRLRHALKLSQPDMAKILGPSLRAYQGYEYGRYEIPAIGKVACWHLAITLKPKLAKQWPEGENLEKLIEKKVEK